MAVCSPCANAGSANRELYNRGERDMFYSHPTDCACTCQHSDPQEWEKYFLVEEPKSDSTS